MARVLVSFIGRGDKISQHGAPETATGYQTASYQFPGETQPGEPTAFFGVALLNYLGKTNPVNRWLILGTCGSNWATLATVTGSNVPNDLKEIHRDIDGWTDDETITEEQLKKWQDDLQKHLKSTVLICRITGSAKEPKSQQAMWSAMLDAIQLGDEVTLDITHAFRHMPVLASFMVSSLRWIRNLTKVDLYYGALEMVEEGETVSVLHLPLVNELMEVAEAAATYNHTGSYKPILDVLGFKDDMEAQALVYADELNQNAAEIAKNLKKRVKEVTDKPIASDLMPHIEESLDWVTKDNLALQMAHKAKRACENEQYSNAIALLFEAIRTAFAETIRPKKTTEYEIREAAWKTFVDSASQQDRSCLENIKKLRHAVMHGSRSNSNTVNMALHNPKKFDDIMRKGLKFLDDYLNKNALS